jgi:hypothetical protein
VCVTLACDGNEVPIGDLLRRHGIVCSYAGGTVGGRIVVSANICRNTKVTGIYFTAVAGVSSPAHIVGNYVSRTGLTDATANQGAICLIAEGTGDIVASNTVEDIPFGPGIRVTSSQNSTTDPTKGRTLVHGNVIRACTAPLPVGTSGWTGALHIGLFAQCVDVRGNLFTDNSVTDIEVGPNPGGRDGDYTIVGNTFNKTDDVNTVIGSQSTTAGGSLSTGVYLYRVTFVTPTAETYAGSTSAPITVDPAVAGRQIALLRVPLGPSGSAVTSRKIYRTEHDGSAFKLVDTIADNVTTTYTDGVADAALGAAPPATALRPTCLHAYLYDSTRLTCIEDNVFNGGGLTTSAIEFSRKYVSIRRNTITGFEAGVQALAYTTTGRQFGLPFVDYNSFRDCTDGIRLSGSDGVTTQVVEGNTFVNCTNPVRPWVGGGLGYPCAYIGRRQGTRLFVEHTGVPANGTWTAGDVVQRAAPGSGLSGVTQFVCRVSGAVPVAKWVANEAVLGVGADRGDASVTLTVGSDEPTQTFATALTANRTVTLSTTNAVAGDSFRIVRTGLGAFTLAVGALKTIPASTAAAVEVTFNGTAWVLTGYSIL